MAITIGLLNTTNFYFTFAEGTGGTSDGGGTAGTAGDGVEVVNNFYEPIWVNNIQLISAYDKSMVSRSTYYSIWTPNYSEIRVKAYD